MSRSLAILLSAVLVAVATAQQSDPGAPSAKPVPGFRSVDIGGRTLRYKCMGTGTPTVLIEPGGGVSLETVFSWDQSIGWAAIFPEVRKTTLTCVYDRAGLGRSDPAPMPRTSLDMARDLEALLRAAAIPPPYVLAGQSLGGMNVRMFASLYPHQVAGAVLVDSSDPDTYPELRKALPPPAPGESPFLAGWRNGPDLSHTREWIDFEANGNLVRATQGFGDKPLIILTASPSWDDPFAPDEVEPIIDGVHQRLQAELLKLSTHSRQVVAQKAGHNIQADEPQLVIDAILDVVSQARAPKKSRD